jgi:rhodanese-related sulfurtransferase
MSSGVCNYNLTPAMNPTIRLNPQQAAARADGVLLDVRTPVEHRSVHIAGARHIPLDELKPEALVQELNGQRVVLVCRSGRRAEQAAAKLAAAGCTDLCVLDGGMDAWLAAGLPVNRGPAVMSLERQVRIAIGSLVLLGFALGFWVHPGWYGICAFMGAGLIFAGITDFCGLGLILARAPWNKRGGSCGACSAN